MSFILKTFMDWLWTKLSGLVSAYLKRRREEKEIEDLVHKDIDKLKHAETEAEREEAIKNIGSGI